MCLLSNYTNVDIVSQLYICIDNTTHHSIVLNIIIFGATWTLALLILLMCCVGFWIVLCDTRKICKKCCFRICNNSSKQSNTDCCPICFEELQGSCYKTRCGHYYHRECLNKFVDFQVDHSHKVMCAICRKKNMLYLL